MDRATIGDGESRPPLDLGTVAPDRLIVRLTWGFVILGIALRVGRVLLDFPLWWDESFVAVNFLRRGFLDLLEPLDYGQVCPLLFLWAERAAVGLLGFDEWTLRLVPLLAAVASVPLFRHAAGRVVGGLPLLLAVAIFAVSFHPIRHAADVKPYATDLFASLGLLSLAIEWWRRPDRVGWLWGLTAAAPLALAGSHPAAFVAGGIGVALTPAVLATRDRRAIAALTAFLVATVGTFGLLYLGFTGAQADATLAAMRPDWEGSFPPLGGPLRLVGWFVAIHAGHLAAYPCGGPAGASAATLILVIVGSAVLWRSDRRTVLALCLAPLGVALVAAAIRRYPYGGSARFMQYAAPSLCLLAGLGAAAVLGRVRRPGLRRRAVRLAVAGLVVVGVAPLVGDLFHPYRSVHADRTRRFARSFWPMLADGAEVACARWDYGVGSWNSIHLDRPVYLCNQAIYGPNRRPGAVPGPVSATHPLRCVLANPVDEEAAEVDAWLDRMATRYELRGRSTLTVDMSRPGATPRPEKYVIYEFVPRAALRSPAGPTARDTAARAAPTPRRRR